MKYIYILIIFIILFLLFIINKRKNIEKYQERIIPCSKNYNSSVPNFPYKHSQMTNREKLLNSCNTQTPRCEGYIPDVKLGKCIGPPLIEKKNLGYDYTITNKFVNTGNKKGSCFREKIPNTESYRYGKKIPNTESYTTIEKCKNQCLSTEYCDGYQYDYNNELCSLYNMSGDGSQCSSACVEPVIVRQHFLHDKSGWEAPFRKGRYNLFGGSANGARNDDASSIIVPNGCIAHVYHDKNQRGSKSTYHKGEYNLNTKSDGDNEASSIMVTDDTENLQFFRKNRTKIIHTRAPIDYNDVRKDPTYTCPDARFPYIANKGQKCYNNHKYVKNNKGPCNTWCTNNPKKVTNCGKLCNSIQKSIINDDTCSTKINGICERDTQFIIKHEVKKNYTIIYTKLNPLGIKISNKYIGKSYKPIKILINIKSIEHDSYYPSINTFYFDSQKIYISKKNLKYFYGKGLENVDSFYLVIPYTSHYIPTDNGAVIAKNNCGTSEHLAKSNEVTDLTFNSIKTKIEMAKAVGDYHTQSKAENDLVIAMSKLNDEEKRALTLGMSNVEKAKGIIEIKESKKQNPFIKDEYNQCKYDYGTHTDCDNNKIDPRDTCPEYQRYCVGYDKNTPSLGVCQKKNINSCSDKDIEENCLIGRKILYIIPHKTKHWNVTANREYHSDYYRKCNYDWKNKVGLKRHLPLRTVNNINIARTANVDTDINCIQAKEEAKSCNLVFVRNAGDGRPYLIKGKNKPSCKYYVSSDAVGNPYYASNKYRESRYTATENVNDCIKKISQMKDQRRFDQKGVHMKYTNCNGEVQSDLNLQTPKDFPNKNYKYVGCYSGRDIKYNNPIMRKNGTYSTMRNNRTYWTEPDIEKCLKKCRYSKYASLQTSEHPLARGSYCSCDDRITASRRSFTKCNRGNTHGTLGFGLGSNNTKAVYRNYNYDNNSNPIEKYNKTHPTLISNNKTDSSWLLGHNIECKNNGYLKSVNSGQRYTDGTYGFSYENKCINHDKSDLGLSFLHYTRTPESHPNQTRIRTEETNTTDYGDGDITNLTDLNVECKRGLLNRMQLRKKDNLINYEYACTAGHNTYDCTKHETDYSTVETKLKNSQKDCWDKCDKKGGLCNFCGTGKCCRPNWHNRDVKDNTCKSDDGIANRGHVCVNHIPNENVVNLKSQLYCPSGKGLSKIKMERLLVKNCQSIPDETKKLINYIDGREGCIYNMWRGSLARDTGDNIRFDRWAAGYGELSGRESYWGQWGGDEKFTIYSITENGKITDRITMKGGKHNRNCGRQWGKTKVLCKGDKRDIARNSDGSEQQLKLELVGGKFKQDLGAWPVYITEIDKFGNNKKWTIRKKTVDGSEVHADEATIKGDIFIIGDPRRLKQYDGMMDGCHKELPEGTKLPGHKYTYTCCKTRYY